LCVVNILGAKESAGLNIALAVVDFLTQVLLVLLGAFLVLSPSALVDSIHLGVAPTWTQFLLAIPVGMIAYTGIETISNMAEEAKDEGTTIPAAINRVQIAVFAIYFTLPAVALSALPVSFDASRGEYVTLLGLPEDEGGFAGDPILGVVKSIDLGLLQGPAELYVGLLAATILILATNAGIIGVSRLVYSMGIYRQVPDRLRRLHPKFGTPWIGILIFGVAAMLILLPGQATFLGNLYAFGAMLSFTVAHVAVIRLRIIAPDAERPYRGPFNFRLRGYDIPGFAVFGGLATFAAFVVVTALHPEVAISGVVWLILGIVVYVAFRRHEGLSLTGTTKVVVPRPVVDHEAEYESVLVAFDVGNFNRSTVATAARLAARRRRGIYILVTITVPNSSPIDAQLPDQEMAAQGIIEQAKVQAGRRVNGRWTKVRAGQAGRVIVEEAKEMRARAIVLPLPPRTGTTTFGKTVETVLAERPARVIIEASPSDGGGNPTLSGRARPA
ncbi:MAG: basic amino acid/polyamine antiporter, family, partial [Solirubrobacteraceae bacterium]|nr:basic amino acid/polyamine antiporter, family [Solirubrobacteraceae bacterium]